ncbi:MAG TPA: LysE family translocator [Pontibacter sp.]
MGIENFFAFIVTAIIFVITPGIDTVFVINKSITQGRKAGIYSTLGVNAGVLVHTLFAALGLSLIVAKSALAFSVIKYLGAAYLVYLGVSKMRSKATAIQTPTGETVMNSNRQNFMSGLITDVLNPKIALFFLAFFPQFINPDMINSPTPFIVLGVTYALLGVLWFMILTLFASLFSEKLAANARANEWLNKIAGITYILMGLKIALTRR